MPLPALLLNPWTLGILGSVLPSVISALAGSKTPEEARAAIEPQHNAMVTQLIGRGMRRSEAIAQADEALKGALADKAQEGSVPPWADAVMSVAGGIGGGALGAKLAKGAVKGAMQGVGKAGVADAAKAATVEKAANTATKGAGASKSAAGGVKAETAATEASETLPTQSMAEEAGELHRPFGQSSAIATPPAPAAMPVIKVADALAKPPVRRTLLHPFGGNPIPTNPATGAPYQYLDEIPDHMGRVGV